MKILFVAPRYHTNQHLIIKELKKYGNEVRFYVQYVGGSEEYSELKPEVIEYSLLFRSIKSLFKNLNKNSSDTFNIERRFGFPSIFKYYKKINLYNPDLVIVRNRSVWSIITFIICKLQKRKAILYTQKPKYYDINVEYEKKGLFKIILFKLLDSVIPKVRITPVEGNKNYICDYKAYYLPFVAEINEGYDKNWFKNNKINIVSVGKFEKRKNHILLLEAINKLKDKFQVKVTLIGEKTTKHHDDYYNEVINFINLNSLEDIVDIKTNICLKEVIDTYKKNDLFILPSSNEPASVSLLEAMASYLPVICSDSNGTMCYINSGYNGYIFESDNLNDLIEKMILIMTNRKKLMKMGYRSFKIAKENHNPKRYYDGIMEILSKEF